jgi:hypothetical protein
MTEYIIHITQTNDVIVSPYEYLIPILIVATIIFLSWLAWLVTFDSKVNYPTLNSERVLRMGLPDS